MYLRTIQIKKDWSALLERLPGWKSDGSNRYTNGASTFCSNRNNPPGNFGLETTLKEEFEKFDEKENAIGGGDYLIFHLPSYSQHISVEKVASVPPEDNYILNHIALETTSLDEQVPLLGRAS